MRQSINDRIICLKCRNGGRMNNVDLKAQKTQCCPFVDKRLTADAADIFTLINGYSKY